MEFFINIEEVYVTKRTMNQPEIIISHVPVSTITKDHPVYEMIMDVFKCVETIGEVDLQFSPNMIHVHLNVFMHECQTREDMNRILSSSIVGLYSKTVRDGQLSYSYYLNLDKVSFEEFQEIKDPGYD